MTTVSLPRDPGDANLSAADEQPRFERVWWTLFHLSAIVGWLALAGCLLTGVVGEMFAAVTLLTVSASAFAAAGLAATFLPPAAPHAPVMASGGTKGFGRRVHNGLLV